MTTPFRREYHIGNWFFTYFKYKHDRTDKREKIQYLIHPEVETAPLILPQPVNINNQKCISQPLSLISLLINVFYHVLF